MVDRVLTFFIGWWVKQILYLLRK